MSCESKSHALNLLLVLIPSTSLENIVESLHFICYVTIKLKNKPWTYLLFNTKDTIKKYILKFNCNVTYKV